jgi:hypothetical protein
VAASFSQQGDDMKYLKILVLVAIAAMTLSAFAGTASATVLCKEAITTGCAAAGKAYPAGTLIKRSLEGSSILSSGETTLGTCTEGQFTSEITNAGSSTTTVSGPNKTTDLENCANPVHTVALGMLEIHHIAGTDNGTVTASGSVTGYTIFGTHCVYESGTGKDLGELKGGSSASLNVNVTTNEAEPKKFICADTTTWQASFRFTTPTPLYVSAS